VPVAPDADAGTSKIKIAAIAPSAADPPWRRNVPRTETLKLDAMM
jgi:hypothetical protein